LAKGTPYPAEYLSFSLQVANIVFVRVSKYRSCSSYCSDKFDWELEDGGSRPAGSPCFYPGPPFFNNFQFRPSDPAYCTLWGSIEPRTDRRIADAFLLWWQLAAVSPRPLVHIQVDGPTRLHLSPDTEGYVQLNFNLLKEGVFTPPIHVYWTAHGVVIDPTLESTQIHFPYSHLGPDVEEKRWVSARVVDALGYTAKDNIFIYLITPPSVLPR